MITLKVFKSFGTPSNSLLGEIFLFQNLVVCMYEVSQYFFRYFKALLLMYPYGLDKNLILATSFGFKLNSNFK